MRRGSDCICIGKRILFCTIEEDHTSICPLMRLSIMAILLLLTPMPSLSLAVIAQLVNKKPFVSSGTQSSSYEEAA